MDDKLKTLDEIKAMGEDFKRVYDLRALACVNALAGIPDPAAFMRDVRELMIVETSIPINRQIDVICEHLKGGDA